MNAKEFKQELASAKNKVKQLKAANNYHKAVIAVRDAEAEIYRSEKRKCAWIIVALFLFGFWSNVYHLLG